MVVIDPEITLVMDGAILICNVLSHQITCSFVVATYMSVNGSYQLVGGYGRTWVTGGSVEKCVASIQVI
jgi:hypothetical protein